jgi:hypothetical protein
MPKTLGELADQISMPAEVVERLIDAANLADGPFCDVVDRVLEKLGGIVPRWPVLEDWNRWCFRRRMTFFVWQPHAGELQERERLEVLVHTIAMLAAKQQAIDSYRHAGIAEAEVVMAGDDCALCDEHRHRILRLDAAPRHELPPFHPGCRCGTLPRLE